MIWKNRPTLEELNNLNINTMVTHLGIEFTEIGDDYLIAKMPVDHRTIQPAGLLHGGASVTLAESIGSTASYIASDDVKNRGIVGIEINANHLKSVKDGFVYGTARPFKIGRKLHVWNIEITNEAGDLVCVSRLTTMILDK